MLKGIGATVIRVQREPLPEWFNKVGELNIKGYNMYGITNLVPEVKDIHISELDWIGYDDPDYVINAVTGDFDNMYKQINTIMEIING